VSKSLGILALAVFVLGISALAQHQHHQADQSKDDQVMHSHRPTGESDGHPGTVTGYVRDVACLLRNPKAGVATTALTKDCLKKCIREGSPIAILTEEGELYIPISNLVPDKSARAQLLPYAGKYVTAKGKLFDRGGLHAISISSIVVISRPPDSKIPTL
jgi:hypothetical protein